MPMEIKNKLEKVIDEFYQRFYDCRTIRNCLDLWLWEKVEFDILEKLCYNAQICYEEFQNTMRDLRICNIKLQNDILEKIDQYSETEN